MFTSIRRRLRRGPIVVALAAAAVTVVGGTAYAVESAADSTSSTVINACVGKITGLVRIVDAGSSCLRNENAVSWNQTGPAGPQGPQGSPGPQGSQGSPGPTVTVTATPPAPSDTSTTGTTTGGAGAGKGGLLTGATITFDQLGSKPNVVIGIESFAEGLGTGGTEIVPALSDALITKQVDENSAALFAAATHHTNLGNATIQAPAAGGNGPVTIKLRDVTVSGFSLSSPNAGSADESLSLHFDDISYNGADYRLPGANGSSPTTSTSSSPSASPSGWNLGTSTNP